MDNKIIDEDPRLDKNKKKDNKRNVFVKTAYVTMEDVAKKVGVTRRTVFNALNHPDMVAPKTKQRILDAVKEMNYKESFLSRAFRTGETKTIGLVIAEALSPNFMYFLDRIENYARENSYNVITCFTRNRIEYEKQILDMLFQRKVDGIIICPDLLDNPKRDFTHIYEISKVIPTLAIYFHYPLKDINIYTYDGYKAMKDLINIFLSKNTKKIVYLYNNLGYDCLDNIKDFYLKVMKENNLTSKYYNLHKDRLSVFKKIVKGVLEGDIQGLMFETDEDCFRFLSYCDKNNINIKKKCNIISVWDGNFAESLDITASQISRTTLPDTIISDLIKTIKGQKILDGDKLFENKIIIRNSTNIVF